MSDEHETTAASSDGHLLWRLSADRHPYLHNVFALLGVDPDAGQEEFEQRRAWLEQRLGLDQQVQRHGRQVDEADVAQADYLATRETAFAAERLLAHTSHRIDVQAFQTWLAAIEAVSFPHPQELLPLPLADASCLTELLPSLERSSQTIPTLDLTLIQTAIAGRPEGEQGALF